MKKPVRRILFSTLVFSLVLFSCAGKEQSPLVTLQEPPVTLLLPQGFEPLKDETFKKLTAQTASVPPLAALPRAAFRKASAGAGILVSSVTLEKPAAAYAEPRDAIYEYEKNLSALLGVASVATRLIETNDFILVTMEAVSGGGGPGAEKKGSPPVRLTRGVYYLPSGEFMMIDLFVNPEVLTEGEEEAYFDLFMSVKSIQK
ncbi:MAG: hypothetical protein LBC67_04390 [Spirochaetales bacterium]|jgi:hypothetical protein|nr:hypothetical protein [Spirochaetales bacterium]